MVIREVPVANGNWKPLPVYDVMLCKAIKQAGKNMIYINTILALTIVYLVTKLYFEHVEMRKSIDAKKARS
jgi:hypothetical protein